jgi:hypothetical protein
MTFELNFYVLPTEVYLLIMAISIFFYFGSHGITKCILIHFSLDFCYLEPGGTYIKLENQNYFIINS